jgi:hypothetical protein
MENYNQSSNQFSDYTVVGSSVKPISKTFMASVFTWMFVALGVSAMVAYGVASNRELLLELFTTPLRWLIILAPLGFVMAMGVGFQKFSVNTMRLLFILFAVVNGISLSAILVIYTSGSIVACFGSASAMFGIMALMGYTTDKDLTSFGRILTMGLVGIVIASLINMFLKSDSMDFLISIIGVAVFTGLTAYDVQKLKRIGAGVEYEGSSHDVQKISIMGALTLYLDFINLFIMLLRLFGRRRD